MRLAVALALATGARLAAADPQSDTLFEEGRKLLDQGNAKAACEKFDKAIQIDPTAAGTMLNLGLCNEKLGKYATALYWFRRAQTAAAEAHPRLPQHEQVAKDHTAALVQKVATINVSFGGEAPANAKLRIDHVDVKPEDYGHVEVDPGHHELDAGAPGMKNVHQEFDVTDQPGPGPNLAVSFVAGDNTIVIDRGRTKRQLAIYTAIGGGALLVIDAFVGMQAAHEYFGGPSFWTDWYKQPSGKNVLAAKMNVQSAKDAIKSGQDLAKYWGTGLFVVSAAAIATASVLYFTAPQQEKIDQTVFVPTVDRNGAGFALTGRF